MLEWILAGAALCVVFALLGGVAKVVLIGFKVLLALFLLPLHLVGALLALLGGALAIPALVLAAVVAVVALVFTLVLAPFLPLALLVAAILGMARLVRPHRA